MILSSIIMFGFYTISKRFFLKREVLFDVRVVSFTKIEYDFAAYFLYSFIKS